MTVCGFDDEGAFMKRYVCVYTIIFGILLLFLLTGGISYGIVIEEHDHMYAPDGSKGSAVFLIYNVITYIVCFIAAIIASFVKKNKLRIKWLIPIAVLIFICVLPIVMVTSVGGISGIPCKVYRSFITSFIM